MRGQYRFWDQTWSVPEKNHYKTGKSRGVIALVKLMKNLRKNKISYRIFEELQLDNTILMTIVWNDEVL